MARTKLQVTADAAHIGLDRQPAHAGQIGKIVRSRTRDLHHVLHDATGGLNTLSDERGIHAGQPECANPQSIAIAFEQAGDPRCSVAARRDQACHDHPVGSAQSGRRDVTAIHVRPVGTGIRVALRSFPKTS
jgi:hypothetical protein